MGSVTRRALFAAIVAVALWGCTAMPPAGAAMVATRLFFGMSIPGGGRVGEADWRGFLKHEVTPRFPDGLTVLPATGQWRDRATGRVVREPSRVLLLLHKGSPKSETAIRAIMDAYKKRFRQDAVLRVDTAVRVAF